MTMFLSFNSLLLIIPIFVLQYALALVCLSKLVKMHFSTCYKISRVQYWVWNIFILVGIGVGIITFAICKTFFAEKVFGFDKNIEYEVADYVPKDKAATKSQEIECDSDEIKHD